MVYDQTEQLPGCDWTEEHTAQGFARRESTVCFGTLLEFGHADVSVMVGSYQAQSDYERVISVPFRSVSGKVTVEGPEEFEVNRAFEMPCGDYKLTAAQAIVGEDEERIDLFFEPVFAPINGSAILVADEMLKPQEALIETAGRAGASEK